MEQVIAGIGYRAQPAKGRPPLHDCMICETPFERGEEFAMVPTRPLNDAEALKAERGEPYVAWHEPVHCLCFAVRIAAAAGFMRRIAQA